ncbi:MAG: undecaprenyl-diphosphatase UppP [Firmicutes bacterium]|jgi:undecaprenyl-diphosphatase|nr:undecaprenyl-diphosphatase UppP [Bacillota bacterium]
MSPLQALILGVVQGLTEFLPVSSSGHLVVAQELMGLRLPGVTFEVCVHLGTLVAVLVVFREEISQIIAALGSLIDRGSHRRREGLSLLWAVIVGSIPAGLVGVLFSDKVGKLFERTDVVGWALLATGGLLWLSDRRAKAHGILIEEIRPKDALFVGLGQALALIPGLSRSGTTIAFGLLRGLDRETAARFSFMLSIPAIGGAALLELGQLQAFDLESGLGVLLVGTVSAAVSGYLAVSLLLRLIRSNRLTYFSYYTWAIGLVLILRSFLKGSGI